MHARFEAETNQWVMDLPYRVNRVKPREEIPLHTHGFIELVYTFRGKGVHHIDGKVYPVKRGDLLIVNYHCRHAVYPSNDLEYTDIMLKPDYVDENLKDADNAFSLLGSSDFRDFSGRVNTDNCALRFSGEERDKLETLIRWTEEEQRKNSVGSGLMLRSALNLLLVTVFRKMALPLCEPLAISEALLSYIREHCGEPLRPEALAERCFYTPAHFSRLFKAYTGMTVTQYIGKCRIEKAKHLLTETRLSVEQILEACGFSNRTKFFRRFAEETGMTPLKYRKSQENSSDIKK